MTDPLNEGKWRTSKNGHRIYIERGKVTKGNPYLMRAIKGKRESLGEAVTTNATPAQKATAQKMTQPGAGKNYLRGRYRFGDRVKWKGDYWLLFAVNDEDPIDYTFDLISPDFTKFARNVTPDEWSSWHSQDFWGSRLPESMTVGARVRDPEDGATGVVVGQPEVSYDEEVGVEVSLVPVKWDGTDVVTTVSSEEIEPIDEAAAVAVDIERAIIDYFIRRGNEPADAADIARTPELRGVHYKDIEKAVKALSRRSRLKPALGKMWQLVPSLTDVREQLDESFALSSSAITARNKGDQIVQLTNKIGRFTAYSAMPISKAVAKLPKDKQPSPGFVYSMSDYTADDSALMRDPIIDEFDIPSFLKKIDKVMDQLHLPSADWALVFSAPNGTSSNPSGWMFHQAGSGPVSPVYLNRTPSPTATGKYASWGAPRSPHTMVHEYAHVVWFGQMTKEQRNAITAYYDKNVKPNPAKAISAKLSPTEYGTTNVQEFWAEIVGYAMYGKGTRIAGEVFDLIADVLGGSIKADDVIATGDTVSPKGTIETPAPKDEPATSGSPAAQAVAAVSASIKKAVGDYTVEPRPDGTVRVIPKAKPKDADTLLRLMIAAGFNRNPSGMKLRPSTGSSGGVVVSESMVFAEGEVTVSSNDEETRIEEAFKLSTKDPGTMTAAEINKELDKLENVSSEMIDKFIAMGRGDWTPTDQAFAAGKGDGLSAQYLALTDRQNDLRVEVTRRYGSNVRRLPRGGARIKANESLDEMAKLSAGDRGVLMRAYKETAVTDDEAIDWRRTTRAWMDDGKVLEKFDVNFKATGTASYQKARKHSYGWKVAGKIKADLLDDAAALTKALESTRSKLTASGWTIEEFNPPK